MPDGGGGFCTSSMSREGLPGGLSVLSFDMTYHLQNGTDIN